MFKAMSRVGACALAVIFAMLATALTTVPAQAASTWGPWSGTISISSHESWADWSKNVSATFSNVQVSGTYTDDETAPNSYRADVDMSVNISGGACEGGFVGSYNGPSTGMSAASIRAVGIDYEGVVVQLMESGDARETYFAPNDLWVFAATPCEGGWTDFGGGLSFHHGLYGAYRWATEPLADSDPDPAHLVGTTSWSMGNYPDNEPYWGDYTGYSYTVTYDLTREPLTGSHCDDGIDNDGDGTSDFGSDPGCTSANDSSELGTAQCDNGIDDDGNGSIDYRADGGDPGCTSLSDTRESATDCSTNPADNHYAVMKAPTELDVAFAPDPHLGTLNMGMHWCMTDTGPKIKKRPEAVSDPTAWWDGTENWVLLGALESFAGITLDTPTPVVTPGKVTSNVSTSLRANLNAVDAVLNAVPVGKLFGPAKKALGKYSKKLNPIAKQLRKHSEKVWKASKRVEKTEVAVRKARARTAELNRLVAAAKAQVGLTRTNAERKVAVARVAALTRSAQSAKRVERKLSLDNQRAYSDLRKAKADQSKSARNVEKVLKSVRSALDKATNFKTKIVDGLNAAVNNVRPDWAREVVRKLADQLIAQMDRALAAFKTSIKSLKSSKLAKIMDSGTATSEILTHLKNEYAAGLDKISSIGIPVWDANLTVSIDQSGNLAVADNSQSRFMFTVKAKPTVTTN